MLRQLQIYYVSVSSYNTISDPYVVRGKFIATACLGHSCYMLIEKKLTKVTCHISSSSSLFESDHKIHRIYHKEKQKERK